MTPGPCDLTRGPAGQRAGQAQPLADFPKSSRDHLPPSVLETGGQPREGITAPRPPGAGPGEGSPCPVLPKRSRLCVCLGDFETDVLDSVAAGFTSSHPEPGEEGARAQPARPLLPRAPVKLWTPLCLTCSNGALRPLSWGRGWGREFGEKQLKAQTVSYLRRTQSQNAAPCTKSLPCHLMGWTETRLCEPCLMQLHSCTECRSIALLRGGRS